MMVSFAQNYVYEIPLLLLKMAIVCSFSLLYSTPLYNYTTIYPALGGHLHSFQFVATMSNIAMTVFVHVF